MLLNTRANIAYTGCHALPHKRESNPESGPLYGSSGLPMAEDVEYHHYDHGYSAAVIAATKFPQFLKSLIQYDGDNFTSISEVNATVFRTDTVESSKQIIVHDEISERNNTRGDVWWSGALYRASLRSNFVTDPEGKMGMPNLQPKEAMKLLSGYNPDYVNVPDKETVWNHLTIDNKLNETFYNPIVCLTSDDAKTLVGGMTYVINEPLEKQTNSSGSNGTMMIDVIDPTNQHHNYTADELSKDSAQCWEWNLERFVKPWLAVGDDDGNNSKNTSATTSISLYPPRTSTDSSSATSTQASSSETTSGIESTSSNFSTSSDRSTTAFPTSSEPTSKTSATSQS
ncbi:hypothetical protein V866_008631 [Kwoniella sp. B9012]